MAGEDKIAVLYGEVAKTRELGTIEEFTEKMRDGSKRVAFFNDVAKEYNLGSFAEFDTKIQEDLKKKNISTTLEEAALRESKPSGENGSGEEAGIGSAFEGGHLQRRIADDLGSLARIAENPELLESKSFNFGSFGGKFEVPGADRQVLVDNILKNVSAMAQLPQNEVINKAGQIAQDEEIGQLKRLKDSIGTLLTEGNPFENISQLIASSVGSGPEAIVAGTLGAGFGPLGIAIGNFMGSMSAESSNAITGALVDEGVNIADPEQLQKAFSDPELAARVQEKALARGAGVGTVDALFSLALPLIGRAKINPIAKGLTGFTSESIGEAGSEIGGQVAAGEGINLAEAGLEAVASAGQSSATTGVSLSTTAAKKAAKKLSKETKNDQTDGRTDGEEGHKQPDIKEDKESSKEKPVVQETEDAQNTDKPKEEVDGKVLSESGTEEAFVREETGSGKEDSGPQADETGEKAAVQKKQEPAKVVPEGKGTWRAAFNKEKDLHKKKDILRAVADTSTNLNEQKDLLEASKGMPDESNIVHAVISKKENQKENIETVLNDPEFSDLSKGNATDLAKSKGIKVTEPAKVEDFVPAEPKNSDTLSVESKTGNEINYTFEDGKWSFTDSKGKKQFETEKRSQELTETFKENQVPAGTTKKDDISKPDNSDAGVSAEQSTEKNDSESRGASDRDSGVESTPIFDNSAILTGKQKKKQANVTPELSDQGKLDDSVSNELTVKEAKRIVKDNDFDTVEKTVKDQKNGMVPVLRRVTTLELAKKAKRDGNRDKAVELFDVYAEEGSQGAKSIQAGAIARQDPEVATIELIKNVRDANQETLNTPTEEGKTIETSISETQKEIQKIAAKAGVELSKSDNLESAINKIVKSKVTPGEKQKVSKAKIRRARDKRSKLIDDFKNAPNDLANASIIPGLTPQSVEFIGKLAQTYAEEGIASIELIAAKVQEEIEKNFGKKVEIADIEKALEQAETKKLVDKGIKELDIEIKDLVREHFSQKEATNRSLQEKLTEDLGLTDEKAKKLSQAISDEFQNRVKDQAQAELDKLFSFSKKKPKRSKQSKSESDKLMELMNLGALDGNSFNDVISDRFGLAVVTEEDITQLESLSNAVQTLPEGELRNREIQKFNDYLDQLKGDQLKANALADLALEIWYTSVLSGPSTLSRALKGASLTSSANLLSAAVNNPVATFYGMRGLKHLIRGSRQFGMKGFRQVIKDGFSDIDFFDRAPGKGGRLNEIINTPTKDLLNQEKGVLKAAAKFWMYLPAKMYRNLLASDAVMKHGIKEFEAYIIEYNKLLAEGRHSRFSQEFTNELNKRLRLDEPTLEAAKQQAKDEIALLDQEERDIPLGYEERRVQEIVDQKRDPDTTKRAVMQANEAVLMNEPVGALGSFYRFMSRAGNIKETDSKIEMYGKLLFRSVFPFLRVPTNFINMNLDFTPIGAVRGFRGTRRDSNNQRINLTPEQRGRHYARSAIGMTAFTGLLMTIFDWDEDEGFSLDKDSPIQVTGNGKGGYYENLGIDEDFKPFSFRIKNPTTGEWSSRFSFIDNPLGMVLAPIGLMSDEMRFKDFKKKINENDLDEEKRSLGYLATNGMWMAMNFASSQSYVQGLENFMGVISPGVTSEKKSENAAKLVSNPPKGLLMPSLYRQIYGQYKALMDIPQKEATTIPQKIFNDIPLWEQMMIENDRYDQFGYPIIKDFNVPLIPDIILKQMKDTRTYREGKKEWQLVYKFDKVTIGSPFRAPQKKGLTDDQKSEYVRRVGENLRSLINDDFDYLNQLNAEELQARLNVLRDIAKTETNGELIDSF